MASAKRINGKLRAIAISKRFERSLVRVERVTPVRGTPPRIGRPNITVQRTVSRGGSPAMMIVDFSFGPSKGIPASAGRIILVVIVGIELAGDPDLVLVVNAGGGKRFGFRARKSRQQQRSENGNN